jgi:hypothetical protein
MSERLADYTLQSEGVRSKVDSHEEDERASSSTTGSVDGVCTCMWAGFPCVEKVNSYSDNDNDQNEIGEVEEACASTSGSSMNAYFPRHLLRI